MLLASDAHVVYYMPKCPSLMLGNGATLALQFHDLLKGLFLIFETKLKENNTIL